MNTDVLLRPGAACRDASVETWGCESAPIHLPIHLQPIGAIEIGIGKSENRKIGGGDAYRTDKKSVKHRRPDLHDSSYYLQDSLTSIVKNKDKKTRIYSHAGFADYIGYRLRLKTDVFLNIGAGFADISDIVCAQKRMFF